MAEQARLLPGRATAPTLLFHRLLLKSALADKKKAELKSYKLTNKERFDLEERYETSERDYAAAQANAGALEAQLKTEIETAQSLASQVSMLASQLASSASSSSEATHLRIPEVMRDPRSREQEAPSPRRGAREQARDVATALDAMAAEQERIVDDVTKHESTMAACARANQAIVNDTTLQKTLLEDATKEREQNVPILM